MEKCSQDVKSKSDVVGVAAFNKYETVAEAVENVGEAQLLSMLNAQIRTNAMNEIRAGATGKPSKVKNLFEAIAMCSPEELAACGGDEAKIREIVAQKQAEAEAAKKEESATTASTATDDADDGDEDGDEDDD